MALGFTGERIVPGAADCEPTFAQKMYQEHLARYAFAAQLAIGADVLDVGCGVGYGSQWLGKCGAKSVLGFDLSEAAIEHARMNYFHPAISFKVQDAIAIEPSDGYDLVTCFELIEHIAQQEHVLDLIKGALRKDGALVISTPRPLDNVRTHFHVHEMTFEELHRMLKQRFKYVEPFFQINSFSSFIGAAAPDRIDRIVPVTDRIGMDNADYFVFAASDTPIAEKADLRPLLSMNDDSYILTLEKDVGVLRRAEDNHIARITDLERSEAELTAAIAQSGVIEQVRQDTGILRKATEHLSEQMEKQAAAQAERDSLYQRVQQLELALARAAQPEEVAQLRALLDETRRDAEAQRAQLAAEIAQSGVIEQVRQDTGILRKATEHLSEQMEKQAAAQAERDSLYQRVQQLELALARAAQPEEVVQLRALLDETRRDADAQRAQLATELSALRQIAADEAACDEMAEREAALLSQCEAADAEIDALRDALESVESERDRSEQALAELRRSTEADLDNVRRALAETSVKLAEKGTEAFTLREAAERLPEATARASALENELNALRYRFDQAEATLARFRTSLSWTVTRPLRWIGRTYRKLTGRSLQQ